MPSKKKIEVTFDAKVDKFGRDVDRASSDLNQFSRKAGAASVNIKRSFLGIGSALAGVVSVGALGALTKSALDTADAIGKAAERTGFSVKALQELRFAGDQTGVSLGEMDSALARFTKRLGLARIGTGAAAKTYERLGIDLRQTNEQVFRRVVDTLGDMDNATDRLALTTRLFGDDAQKLALTFKDGTAGIDAFAEKARNLGLILSDDLVKGAEKANDELSVMKQVLDIQFTRTFAELAPLISDVGNAFAEAAKEVGEFYRNLKSGSESAKSDSILSQLDATRKRIREIESQDRPKAREGFLDPVTAELEGLKRLEQQLIESHKRIQAERKKITGPAKAVVASSGTEPTSPTKPSKLPTLNFPKRREVAALNDPIDEFVDSLFKYREELELINPKLERLGVLFAEGAIPVDVYMEGLKRLGFETESLFDDLPEEIEATNDAVNELGLTFASAFEDAIVGGKGLSEVLKGLEQDIARVITRKLVTEPLTNAVSGAFSGGGLFGDLFGGIFGGGKALGGPVMAGTPYLVGERGPELFVPGSNGNITPNNKIGGGTVNVYLTPPPGTSPEALRLSARQGALEGSRLLGKQRSIN